MNNIKKLINIFVLAIFSLNLSGFNAYANDLSENTILNKKPIIKSIHFEENKEKAAFFIIIVGENFRVDPKNTSTTVTVTGLGGKELNITNSIEHILSDKIIARLHKDTKPGIVKITQKHTGTKESVSTDPFHLDISSPEIHFIYGKNGVIPGEEIEIHGKNLSGTFSETLTNFGYIKNATIKENKIILKIPNNNFKEKIYVSKDGLESNPVSLQKLIPPILKTVSMTKSPDVESDKALLKASNLPDDKKNVRVKFNEKSGTIEELDQDKGTLIVAIPKKMPPTYPIYLEIDGVKSNTIVLKENNPLEITSAEYINMQNDKHIIDIYLNNLPSSYNNLDIQIGGTKINKDELSVIFNKIRINTDKNFKSSGEIIVTLNEKYDSEPFNYQFEEQMDPFIYFVESRNGFYAGSIFSIYGANFGLDSGKVKISGVSLDKEFGNQGVKLQGNIIEMMHALDKNKDSNSKKTISLSVTIDGRKSNSVNIPFGTSDTKVVYATPIISGVEFPDGKNIGKKIIISGKNFGTRENHNKLKLGSKDIQVVSVNSRGTKIEALLPEDARSGTLNLTRTFPEEQKSNDFAIIIAPITESSLFFEKVEIEKELIEITDLQQEIEIGKLIAKNYIDDLRINKFEIKMDFKDGGNSDFSFDKLKIAPFDNFYLKKGSKIIAGPAFPVITSKEILISFPPFDLPLTENEQGDEYSIKTTFLPFVSDNSELSTSIDFQNTTTFLARIIDKSVRAIPKNGTLKFEKISIKNNLIKCVESEDFKGYCEKFLNTTVSGKIEEDNKTSNTEKEVVVNKNPSEAEKKTVAKKNPSEDAIIIPEHLQIDTDGDGLFDVEEKLIGSDINKIDTDDDGISDFDEVENATSPIIKGQKLLFLDLDEADWSKKYVSRLKLYGVIKENDYFYPNKPISRGEFLQLTVDAFTKEPLPNVVINPFVDVPMGHKYANQILFAKNKGAIKGYDDKTFRPDANLTRAEAVKILLALKNISANTKNSHFEDLDSWQIPWVQKAFEMGIAKGFSKSQFKPNENVTKAQSAKMILNLIWF